MSVVVRERAPECAASRARRASGREAAIRNFYFVLPIEMRGLQRKLQTDLLVSASLQNVIAVFGNFFRPAVRRNAARFAHVQRRAGEQLRANRRSRFRKFSATAAERA